jgi:hypothetical protein
MHAQPYGAWQFSLRSLMFVTMIVAVCAALVNISLVLAVLLIPLIATGLVRTMRVVMRHEAVGQRNGAVPGLFATLCQSIAILVAMIAVGAATVASAGLTATLIALMIVVHVFRAARVAYRPVTTRASRVLRNLLLRCWAVVSRIKPIAILRWLQLHAVSFTLALFGVCRRLYRQNWAFPPLPVIASTNQSSRQPN